MKEGICMKKISLFANWESKAVKLLKLQGVIVIKLLRTI